jgi:hypothetical protein
MPMQSDMMEFGRAAVKGIDGKNYRETRVHLEPSGELWGKVKVSTEGYASDVPIWHKDVAIVELLERVQAIQDDLDPEE